MYPLAAINMAGVLVRIDSSKISVNTQGDSKPECNTKEGFGEIL
jgi:hypothetical protein